jgi:hypothetical protein
MSTDAVTADGRTRPSADGNELDQDLAVLGALDTTGGTDRALERKWWRN